MLGIFVVAAIITPPDAVSQTMMAIPMYILYEAGILLSRLLVKRVPVRDEGDAEAPPAE
jgi:sec-independent protein translocase protein TatC